jgi:hypothetical protein
MDLKLALVCEEARERPDGRVDFIGVFDALIAPGFPAMQDRMTAVFVMEWGEDELGHQPLRADLVDARERKILTIEGHTDVAARPEHAGPPETRLILGLEKVVFPEAGRYDFQLVAGGDVRRACSIRVTQRADADPG